MNPVAARKDCLNLGATLATVVEEDFAVLEGAMSFDFLGKQAAGLHRVAVARAHYPDASLGDAHALDGPDVEQVGVDAVLTRREDVDLRAFLAAVAEEGFAVLEAIVAVNVAGKNASRF